MVEMVEKCLRKWENDDSPKDDEEDDLKKAFP
jgi:hypothetical protein